MPTKQTGKPPDYPLDGAPNFGKKPNHEEYVHQQEAHEEPGVMQRDPPAADDGRADRYGGAPFVNGSGDAFMMIRPPAFVAWEAAAKPPPVIAAASSIAGPTSPTAADAIMAPAGMRMNV